MDIIVRRVSKYVDITIKNGDTTIALGLHDQAECLKLATEFKTAIVHMLESDQYEQLMREDQ